MIHSVPRPLRFDFASLLIAVLAVGLIAPARAGVAQGAFADAGIGARPLGMGGAYVALADDIYALNANPAGIGLMNRYALGFDYANLWGMSEVSQSWFGVVVPTRWGNHGVSYQSRGYDLGRINRRLSLVTADYRYTEAMLKYTYGRSLGRVALGVSAKYLSVTSNIAQATATGFGLDLGAHLRIAERWTAGVALTDVLSSLKWGTGTAESLAAAWRLGGAYRISERWHVAAELAGEQGEAFSLLRFGTEYWIVRPEVIARHLGLSREPGESIFRREDPAATPDFSLGVRTGFEKDLAGHRRYTPTFGASLGFAGLRLDYAFLHQGDEGLGSTNRFSLAYDFAPRVEAPPAPTPAADRPAAPPMPARPAAGRIAVLDFANATGDQELAWLELGLADIVTRELQRAGHDVAPRAAVSGAASLAMPEILTMARRTEAGIVVRGLFVRNAPGRMTVTARLIDAATGRTVEFVEFEAGEAEIFALGGSVARAVAQKAGAWRR